MLFLFVPVPLVYVAIGVVIGWILACVIFKQPVSLWKALTLRRHHERGAAGRLCG